MRMSSISKILMMGGIYCPCHQLAFDKDWFGEHDILKVRWAAIVPIISNEHVTWLEFFRFVMFENVRNKLNKASQEHRDAIVLAECRPGWAKDSSRRIPALLDSRGVRSADKRLIHLLNNRCKHRADNLYSNEIYGICVDSCACGGDWRLVETIHRLHS